MGGLPRHRADSSVRDADPDVYVQGSFRLGTAIKPASEEEDYDIDMVCRLKYEMSDLSQADLKNKLGVEIKAYAKRYRMSRPKNGRRCWTLHYSEDAQFHLDALPAIPDYERRRILKESGPALERLGSTALSITDKEHPDYRQISSNWQRSNPKGYSLWFRDRMGSEFQKRALSEATRIQASVEDVPIYRVRTPLQEAIQLLKRHRDITFSDRSDDKPISIIITTLSAHSYDQEPTVATALGSILRRMENYIEVKSGVYWVTNPADPNENFADKWEEHPERKDAFYEWLDKAKSDFSNAAVAINKEAAGEILNESLGDALVDRALTRANPLRKSRFSNALVRAGNLVLFPAYMRKPRWPQAPEGQVQINRATYEQDGFRPQVFYSGGDPLPKNCKLRFEANTDIAGRYKVYWQIVNTGLEAENADSLRGGFDFDGATRGGLTHKESTLYQGQHSIECFIVKRGRLVARSGQFIVNIS